MSGDDLSEIEKRWQRRTLFREQRASVIPRLLGILLLITAIVVLSMWLDVPVLNVTTVGGAG